MIWIIAVAAWVAVSVLASFALYLIRGRRRKKRASRFDPYRSGGIVWEG